MLQGHGQFEKDIIALAPKEAMATNGDLDKEIAGRALGWCSRTPPRDSEHLTIFHAGWNSQIDAGPVRRGKLAHSAADALEHIEAEPNSQVGAARATPSAEQFCKEVVCVGEIRISRAVPVATTTLACREVAIVLLLWTLGTRRIDLAGIETTAFLRIGEQIVGGRDFLERRLSILVAGVDVRMMFPGKTSIDLADFFVRRRRRDTQDLGSVKGFPNAETC